MKEYTYLGIIEEKNESGMYRLEQKNKFNVGETIEVMKPGRQRHFGDCTGDGDSEGISIESCPHPKMEVWVDLGIELEAGDLLRRREESIK